MRRIDTFDIEGRISLGVTQFLRFAQHIIEIASLVAHFGQNEITGAVDDPGNRFDQVGAQTLANRLDDRNTTGYRGLEHHVNAHALGFGENFITVQCNQCLVGGDHMLAIRNRLHHQLERRLIATDQVR